jgi:hypothetical protein
MQYAGYIEKQAQYYVDNEIFPRAILQKYGYWRQKDCQDD